MPGGFEEDFRKIEGIIFWFRHLWFRREGRGEMKLKIVNLIAIQFGIFVGIVGCLVYSRFESAKPRTTAEMKQQATERASAREPVSEPGDQRADSEPAQVVPGQLAPVLPNEYSPEAVERYRAEATRLYYEQIAPRRQTSSSLTYSSSAAVAPSYTEVAQEPAVVQTYDPAPQTVAYVEPAPAIVYAQPAFVAYSHGRRFVNRCRPTPHHGALASSPHRRPDRRGNHFSGSTECRPPRSLGVVHRRNPGVASCAPTQGFRPRGKR